MNNQGQSIDRSFNLVSSEFEAFKRWGFAVSNDKRQNENDKSNIPLSKLSSMPLSDQKRPGLEEKNRR